MLILNARSENASLSDACHEAVDLCNRLGVGVDMTFEGAVIAARPGSHPYNLIQTHERASARGSAAEGGHEER